MDIGFIGLGTMGSRVVANLVKAGNKVRVWNRSRPPVDALARLGATPVSTAREAFGGDAVFSMLADDAAVHAVIDPLLEGAPKGLVHVNMATVSVGLARDLAARHREHGLSYVSATVFGRPELAAAAKLTIVAAGDPGAIARVQPLLDVIGQRTWPMGDEPERANVVKLAGNFMLGAAVEAMSEASAMASRYGSAPGGGGAAPPWGGRGRGRGRTESRRRTTQSVSGAEHHHEEKRPLPESSAIPISRCRVLGKTKERVSPIGLGGWRLGLPKVDEQ